MSRPLSRRIISYWLTAWESRPKSRFFSPVRAIPSVLAAVVAFSVSSRQGKASSSDMWIVIGTIIGVYLILYCVESLWSFAVVSPANLHEALTEQNRALSEIAHPKVTPLEERHRKLVAEKLMDFSESEKAVLQFILDHGKIVSAVLYNSSLDTNAVTTALEKTVKSGLVLHQIEYPPDYDRSSPLTAMRIKRQYWINPTFEKALAFVLEHESE